MKDPREFFDVLEDELRKYGCYGLKFHINTFTTHDRVHILGQYNPVNIVSPSPELDISISIRQCNSVSIEEELHHLLREGTAIASLLHRHIMSFHTSKNAADYESVYNIQMYVKSLDELDTLAKELKNISWREYSNKFDKEMEEELGDQ